MVAHSRVRLIRCLFVTVIPFLIAEDVCSGQEVSVRPGVNNSFEDPDPKSFVERFEVESREVYANREKIVDACGLEPGLTVADIGAGTGLFTRMFAEKVGPKGRVFAVDIAQNFLDHVERTSREAGLNNVETVLCTADSTELPAESVDVAYICDTFHHFEFPLKTMASVHRALKPGGRVILVDFRRIPGVSSEWTLGHVRAGQEVFESEVVQSGFQKTGESSDLLKENYFVTFIKAKSGGLKPLEYPIISGYGGVVAMKNAEDVPMVGAKLVIDVTSSAKPNEVNKGLDRAARLLNLYGTAGLTAQDVKLTIVLHGNATDAVLKSELYAQRFGGEENPHLRLIEKLREAGVDIQVCGQALNYKGYAESMVAEGVSIATSALTTVANRQSQGYGYLPFH
ncbi:MAG: methyltransferase domain-containing protein [Planctomycetaceae bacterium]|nr:methyltransferase domain-containing protein [Planctomycetaceae bacterium]